jgi:phosphotransferase system enzyme I (PtsI)
MSDDAQGSAPEPPASEERGPEPEDVAAEQPPVQPAEEVPERVPGGILLRGATVAPGLVLGRVHRKDYDLAHAGSERVALDEVDRELNRFRRALDESRRQLVDLRTRLKGRVQEEDARILDTHVTYLKDSVFIADVENLILNEQMRLDAAIAKVVGDFDRIFRLVRSDGLRQSAVDLRDVGIRVLRNLDVEGAAADPAEHSVTGDYVLAAKELSIVDMFNLSNEHVKGIVTQEGGLTSHAAIFARSMRIPTLTGVDDLLENVSEGDFVILDATEGLLRVDPDEIVRQQYAEAQSEAGESAAAALAAEAPAWALEEARTKDGVAIEIAASCGNLPEVEHAQGLRMSAVGLYRTELMYLVDASPPSRGALVQHYSSVVGAAQGRPVTFRLLNVDSSLGIPYLHPESEANPSLGRVGVRALLANPAILRRQLQALLLAGHDSDVRIAVPFVSDCGELRRLREILFEERLELRKEEQEVQDSIPVGVVVETPAAMLGIGDLAGEADFLMLNLDSLQQYLLATDRENPELAGAFESLHPYVLRALAKAARVAEKAARPLWVFGVTSRQEQSLPFLVGVGLRRFCVPPANLEGFRRVLGGLDSHAAASAAEAAARHACVDEARSQIAGFQHGYPRDA